MNKNHTVRRIIPSDHDGDDPDSKRLPTAYHLSTWCPASDKLSVHRLLSRRAPTILSGINLNPIAQAVLYITWQKPPKSASRTRIVTAAPMHLTVAS